jgi:probable rRNA maturation factor
MQINIKNPQRKIPVSQKRLKALILKALSLKPGERSGRLNIAFVTDKEIRRLNARYLKRNCVTDVITFDMSLPTAGILADIFVSWEAAMRQARSYQTSALYEAYLYVIHGVLHLLGYDDRTLKQRRLMQKRQEEILSALRN